jgi:hypothetical protein
LTRPQYYATITLPGKKGIDSNLLSGNYRYAYSSASTIDIVRNQGLLYISGSSSDDNPERERQYNITVDIMRAVYMGKLGDPRYSYSDYLFVDNNHVSSVSMRPISAASNGGTVNISEATKAIWDHIKNYHQPVVVVVDSKKQAGNTAKTSNAVPTLHYIVIRGISEESAGGIRRFWIHDPGAYSDVSYSESDLRKLMALPYNTPAWVYNYGYQKVGSDPAYILTVQGD